MKLVVNILLVILYTLPTLAADATGRNNASQPEIFTSSPRVFMKTQAEAYYYYRIQSSTRTLFKRETDGGRFMFSDSRDRKTWYPSINTVPLLQASPPPSPVRHRLDPSERQLALEQLAKNTTEAAELKKTLEERQLQNKLISTETLQKVIVPSSNVLTPSTSSCMGSTTTS